MYRSHTCGELRISDVSKETTLAGWVQTVRKFGAITFVDLRDRYGITQLLFGEEFTGKEEKCRPEGALSLRLDPIKSTGKRAKMWVDIRARDEEHKYTPCTDKET